MPPSGTDCTSGCLSMKYRTHPPVSDDVEAANAWGAISHRNVPTSSMLVHTRTVHMCLNRIRRCRNFNCVYSLGIYVIAAFYSTPVAGGGISHALDILVRTKLLPFLLACP